MKLLIIILTTLGASFAIAHSEVSCQEEAQIIAKISDRKTDNLTYCKAMIDPKSIQHYRANQLCPLDLSEVLRQGIDVGLQNGHDCTVSYGETLTGILVKTKSGQIILSSY